MPALETPDEYPPAMIDEDLGDDDDSMPAGPETPDGLADFLAGWRPPFRDGIAMTHLHRLLDAGDALDMFPQARGNILEPEEELEPGAMIHNIAEPEDEPQVEHCHAM